MLKLTNNNTGRNPYLPRQPRNTELIQSHKI